MRAGGSPVKIGRSSSRMREASTGAGSSWLPLSSRARIAPAAMMTAAPISTTGTPSASASSGMTSEPAAYRTDELVCIAPTARPRSASGTMRWMRVVLTTSRSSSPATATPMASMAVRRSPVSASHARPTPPARPPSRSGTLSRRARSAPPAMPATTPPTPMAALR